MRFKEQHGILLSDLLKKVDKVQCDTLQHNIVKYSTV